MTPSRKTTLNNYLQGRRARQKLATLYYRRLFKASFLISTVPIIVIAILIIYERLSFFEGLIGAVAVCFGSTFFVKPYLDDLSSLTKYVGQLALDKKADTPLLSFLGNVDELSQMVKNLHTSWGNRKMQLEAAIAESSILFDTIPDILLMLDKKLTIVRANHAAISTFDKDLIGKRLQEVANEEPLIEKVKSSLKSGKTRSLETSLEPHGIKQLYWIVIEKFPIKSIDGIALVIVMHNITEESRRKQMLKDFVANASHEIRTPLTSVSGFVENLQSMEGDDTPETKKLRRRFLSIMAEQADRMSNLVNDLLSLSKAEINEDIAPTEIVDINEIIESIQRRLQWLAQEKNMTISFKSRKKLPSIAGDRNELTQVFTNIISNAIKYGNPDTEVEIKTKTATKFHRSKTLPKNCSEILLISIKDHGEGIAEEHISRVTERFYRVDKVRSKKVDGTGLGLSITKHILNRHRSDILIESQLGKGSTFTVRLPVTKKKKFPTKNPATSTGS